MLCLIPELTSSFLLQPEVANHSMAKVQYWQQLKLVMFSRHRPLIVDPKRTTMMKGAASSPNVLMQERDASDNEDNDCTNSPARASSGPMSSAAASAVPSSRVGKPFPIPCVTIPGVFLHPVILYQSFSQLSWFAVAPCNWPLILYPKTRAYLAILCAAAQTFLETPAGLKQPVNTDLRPFNNLMKTSPSSCYMCMLQTAYCCSASERVRVGPHCMGTSQ